MPNLAKIWFHLRRKDELEKSLRRTKPFADQKHYVDYPDGRKLMSAADINQAIDQEIKSAHLAAMEPTPAQT
jgi:hypothetical protein